MDGHTNGQRAMTQACGPLARGTKKLCEEYYGENANYQGPYSPTILSHLCIQDFVNLNVTQLLISSTVWFSQSEVVLHSNAAKYRK